MKKNIAFLFLLLGCQLESEKYLKENTNSTSIFIDSIFETIKIQGDSLTLPYYSKTEVYEVQDTEYLYGYNSSVHSLDVFNLAKRNLEKRILLGSDGPNQISRFYKFKVISEDSIVIMDALKLKILNNKGEIFSIVNLDQRVSSEENHGYFLNYNEAEIGYISDSKSFILHFMNESVRDREFNEDDLPLIFGKINIETGNMEYLPITYPELIIDRKGEVDELMPNVSLIGNELIYGFPIESNIYKYNLGNGNRNIYGGKSNFSENIENFDRTENESFRLVGTWFNRVRYSKYYSLFYRTHWGSQPALNLDFTPTTAYTKPGFIMFFDSEFSVIDEIKISDKYWLEDSFEFSKGICFWLKESDIKSEDVLELGVLKLNISSK